MDETQLQKIVAKISAIQPESRSERVKRVEPLRELIWQSRDRGISWATLSEQLTDEAVIIKPDALRMIMGKRDRKKYPISTVPKMRSRKKRGGEVVDVSAKRLRDAVTVSAPEPEPEPIPKLLRYAPKYESYKPFEY